MNPVISRMKAIIDKTNFMIPLVLNRAKLIKREAAIIRPMAINDTHILSKELILYILPKINYCITFTYKHPIHYNIGPRFVKVNGEYHSLQIPNKIGKEHSIVLSV